MYEVLTYPYASMLDCLAAGACIVHIMWHPVLAPWMPLNAKAAPPRALH